VASIDRSQAEHQSGQTGVQFPVTQYLFAHENFFPYVLDIFTHIFFASFRLRNVYVFLGVMFSQFLASKIRFGRSPHGNIKCLTRSRRVFGKVRHSHPHHA
jgi:hypothetical protein